MDDAALADLVTFARIELESHDLEPWAEMIGFLGTVREVSREGLLWLIKLYNGYDGLGSAWAVFRRWPTPAEWVMAPDSNDAANYPLTQERRGLRGGKVLHHLDSYQAHLDGGNQDRWLRAGLNGEDPSDWAHLTEHLRRVWGVGRQTAFEWAEFLAKAADYPIRAADAQLWESEGPRRSIQKLYGNPTPTAAWLDERAAECRDWLRENGVDLSWEDFETVICDFNVMRDGRYYPGRHLAALREEIDEIPDQVDRVMLLDVFHAIIPSPWRDIAPGIDKAKLAVYRDTGQIIMGPE